MSGRSAKQKILTTSDYDQFNHRENTKKYQKLIAAGALALHEIFGDKAGAVAAFIHDGHGYEGNTYPTDGDPERFQKQIDNIVAAQKSGPKQP